MNTTTTEDTPTAWVGCLACYNSGRLFGRWITAEEWTENAGQLPDIDRAYWVASTYLRTGSPCLACVKCGGDEFAALDTENTPRSVGENLSAWGEWVEAVQDLDEMQVEAFRLYVDYTGYGLDFASAYSLHEDNYIGYYDTFREFAISHFMETTEVPDHLERYLDEDIIERDTHHDFNDARGASGFVHVWWSR